MAHTCEIPTTPRDVRVSKVPSHWPACALWTPTLLAARFPARLFTLGVGEVTTTLSSFFSLRDPTQYIFDEMVSHDDPLLGDFTPPPGTPQTQRDDYLEFITTFPALVPRHRWFLVGQKGCGLTLHQDPHATSAWNALVHGRKLWAVLPPDTPLATVHPGVGECQEAGEGVEAHVGTAQSWFDQVLPGLQAADTMGLRVFEQGEGEVVHIPSGWWHCALTLSEFSIGVTQNYLAKEDFEREVEKLYAKSPNAALDWVGRVKDVGLPFSVSFIP